MLVRYAEVCWWILNNRPGGGVKPGLRVSPFPWCPYYHRGQFRAANVQSLNTELGITRAQLHSQRPWAWLPRTTENHSSVSRRVLEVTEVVRACICSRGCPGQLPVPRRWAPRDVELDMLPLLCSLLGAQPQGHVLGEAFPGSLPCGSLIYCRVLFSPQQLFLY